jgi:hypothetical protein
MTERQDPQPLDYRDGRQELRPLGKRIGEALGGALIGFAAVSFLLVVWVLPNLDLRPYTGPPAPPPPPLPFQWTGPLIVSGIVLSALGISAYAMYRRGRWRWLAAGILLGIGVTALGEGLCFGLTYGR